MKALFRALLGAVVAATLSLSAANAASATYQYKDNQGNLYSVLLWSVCGASGQYCTGMVLEDTNGNAFGVSGNPFYVTPAPGASFGVTGTFWPYTLGQQLAGASVPVVLTAAQLAALTPAAAITNYAQETGGNLATLATDFGAPGAAACASDTASCSQNQQLQRLAQRLTSIVTALNSPFQAGGNIGNTGFTALQAGAANTVSNPFYFSPGTGATFPVTGTFWPYTLGQQLAASSVPVVLTAAQLAALTPAAAITNYAQETGGNLATLATDFGAPGAAACASDTASCSQNQQLQRLAQRLTSIVTALNSPFQAGGNIGNTGFTALQAGAANTVSNPFYFSPGTGATFPVTGTFWPYTLGQQLAASSVPVVLTAAQLTALTPPAWSNTNQIGNTAFAAYGPTATGSAAANPPVLMGGTVDGTGTGIVQGETVLPASTAPTALNPAAVFALSPNGNQATAANQASPTTASATNPTNTLTLPSGTTAYTAGQLICTNATAATCNTALASAHFAIANSAGAAIISRLRLSSNDSTSTAWGAQTIQVDLWSAVPTFTNGDRGTWALATGSANHLGAYTCVMGAENGDGVYAECAPTVGNFSLPKLASGTSIFWSLDAITGSGVTGASKVFTLTAELLN